MMRRNKSTDSAISSETVKTQLGCEHKTKKTKNATTAPAAGWNNRTLAVHERVNSRFLVLPDSLSIFSPDYWAQMF